MKVFNSFPKIVRYGLLLYFLLPYLAFLKYFNLDFHFDYQELAWAVKNSLVQSGITAVIITFLSIPLSLGLFATKENFAGVLAKLLLVPQILPTLFSILIAFSILNPFPLGTSGIIFIFILIHLGFATVLTYSGAQEKLGSYSIQSEIYGIGRFTFFRKIYFPLMKAELLTTFIMIFIFCFSSFSVPLVAGGGRGTNLEVLIYEKIFISQNWSVAWTLNIFQSLFVFLLSFFILKNRAFEQTEFIAGRYLRSKIGLAGVAVYLLVYLGGYVHGLGKSGTAFNQLQPFIEDILIATWQSFSFLIVYLAACFTLLYLWIYDYVKNGAHNISRHLISTSTILVSFSLYLLFPSTLAGDYFKITLAMSILFFPTLFKSFLEKPLDRIKMQILTAQIYGLSTGKIISLIVLRQIKRPLFLWLSFLVIWFLSDFAILKSLGIQRSTLGLMAESFLSSYRLELAYLLSFYILFLWFVTMAAIFLSSGVIDVINKKFKT